MLVEKHEEDTLASIKSKLNEDEIALIATYIKEGIKNLDKL
jgi:hypothetical protein